MADYGLTTIANRGIYCAKCDGEFRIGEDAAQTAQGEMRHMACNQDIKDYRQMTDEILFEAAESEPEAVRELVRRYASLRIQTLEHPAHLGITDTPPEALEWHEIGIYRVAAAKGEDSRNVTWLRYIRVRNGWLISEQNDKNRWTYPVLMPDDARPQPLVNLAEYDVSSGSVSTSGLDSEAEGG